MGKRSHATPRRFLTRITCGDTTSGASGGSTKRSPRSRERTSAFPEARRVLLGVAKALREAPGPDAWIQAIFRLEAIARWAREAEAWDLADLIARQMLEHDPAYGGSHLALALVAEQRSDVPAASRALAAAERCWSRADPDLPELALVRARKARIAADAEP